MASSNVVIAGTTYPSVPAVTLVKSGGGTATFTDVSDTTAAPNDVADTKSFYMSDGTKVSGSVNDCRSGGYTASIGDVSLDGTNMDIDLTDGSNNPYGVIATTAKVPYNAAALGIGLIDNPSDTTSAKIASGNTILGITGTGGGAPTQTKSVTYTSNGSATVTPDTGYALSQVNVTISVSGGTTPPETPENSIIFYSPKGFTLRIYNRTKNWDGVLQYSTNNTSWAIWDGTTTLTADYSDGWYKLYLRGGGNTYITGLAAQNARFVIAGSGIICSGNINKLLNYNGDVTLGERAFTYLFYSCGNVDFQNITLPSTTLATNCYNSMFGLCSSLTVAPHLPATTLANYCYGSMFTSCSSLIATPSFPATTLANNCYNGMFTSCANLTTVSALPVLSLANYCYASMFSNCQSLLTPPALPATTLVEGCYQGMFSGCTSLASINALPATTLANYCYQRMYQNCTQVKISTSKTGAYQNTYRVPMSGTGTTSASAPLGQMFTGTGGTFVGTPTVNTTYYTSNTIISPT